MATNTKYLLSSMASAPALSGTAGALLGILDACLVNGFGSVTLDSLVITDSVATATYGSGHGFLDRTVVLIEGATPSGVNGEKRITWVSSSVFTFDATGIGNQTATGTITAKMAPLGWTKTYSGTNKAAYSRSALGATAMLLRIDDSDAQSARVVGYESMSDVDTGSGPFPTAEQVSGGLYWHKSSTGNSTARDWAIVGDGKTLHLFLGYAASAPKTLEYDSFGDLQTYKASDAYHCCIMGNTSATIGNTGNTNNASNQINNSGTNGCYLARTYAQTGASITFLRHALAGDVFGRAGLTYPNPADDGVYLTPVYANETASIGRGLLRGIYAPRNDCDGAVETGNLSVVINGEPYLAVIPGANTASGGQCWFDLRDWA